MKRQHLQEEQVKENHHDIQSKSREGYNDIISKHQSYITQKCQNPAHKVGL